MPAAPAVFKPHLPKADMHVHLEGTMTPATVRRLAKKNNIVIPAGLLRDDDSGYYWADDGSAAGALKAFVAAYDDACRVLKTADDYTDITYSYLSDAAAEGCIYAEIGISADHGASLGLDYLDMVAAIAAGIDRARHDHAIEARLISTCVRHYGAAASLRVGEQTALHPHPYVTGFGMAGDENAGRVEDFVPAFQAAGLATRTAHAGEAAGPDSVRAAMTQLGCRRFGHMVRASEDAVLMQQLIALGAAPEVCVSSNLVLKVYENYAQHPLRRFVDAGLRVMLGSDDPPFFNTSIGREYQIAQEQFGLDDQALLAITRTAIEEAFVDEETRGRLLARVTAAGG